MQEIIETLEKAAQTGEVLTIKYHGGSQPGKARQIAPIKLSGHQLRARCYTSNAVKVFMIEKIELCESGVPQQCEAWNEPEPPPHYDQIAQIHEKHVNQLERQGWIVHLDDSELRLHRRFKNGRPLKGCDVSITHVPFTYDEYMDLDDDGEWIPARQNERPSARPYHVYAKNRHTTCFANLDRATDRFLQWAKELSPAD